MRYIIRLAIAFAPLAAFADPGHGAPVMHTHLREIAGWVAFGVAVWLATYIARRLMANK